MAIQSTLCAGPDGELRVNVQRDLYLQREIEPKHVTDLFFEREKEMIAAQLIAQGQGGYTD